MSSVAIIVKSGSGAMRVQAKSLLAIVDRRGMTIGMRPDELPPWYDIVPVSDALTAVMTSAFGDAVSASDSFLIVQSRDASDAVSASDSAATVTAFSSSLGDSVSASDVITAQIINRRRFVGGDFIGNHTLG